MRILFLSDNFPPEVNAPATRTFEHCKIWADQGHEVVIITCVPNFPQGQVFEGYKNKIYQKEVIENIIVIRVWSYISSNSGFIKRILDFVSFSFMAFWFGLFQKCDVIIGTSPQFFTAISARWLSFFKRKPWIMEVRDLWPDSIVAVGAMKKESTAFTILKGIEKKLYASADRIVVVTNSFKDYIINLGIDKSKIYVIKNGVNSIDFQPVSKDLGLLAKYKLENKFIIGYIGTHGMAHALNFIINSAIKVKDPEIHFILQGDGSEKEKLMTLAKELRVKNITFLPFVSKSEIRSYISLIDVALVNLMKSETFKTVIPSKIFENACMEKPILLGVEGESKQIIESFNAGLAYEPENEEAFLAAIEEIRNPNSYNKYVEGCKALAKEYERSNLANLMLESIKGSCKRTF